MAAQLCVQRTLPAYRAFFSLDAAKPVEPSQTGHVRPRRWSREHSVPPITRDASERYAFSIHPVSRLPSVTSRRLSIPTPSGGRPAPAYQAQARGSQRTASTPTAAGLSTAPRNVLRRKQSSIVRNPAGSRNPSRTDSSGTRSASSLPPPQASLEPSPSLELDRGLTESPTEIRVAHTVELPKTQAHTVTIYPELDQGPSIELLHKLATQDLPPPTPAYSGTSSQLSAFSASPSTRFSESPGPGPYSRDTTPTSMLSQSPGMPRQLSPVFTSITNEVDSISADLEVLPAVRESLTSSTGKEARQKKAIQKPPTPPPRKSSQQCAKERGQESPGVSLESAQPSINSPPSSKLPLSHRKSPGSGRTTRGAPPVRPSRDGVSNLQSQLYGPPPIIHSNLSSISLASDGHGNEARPVDSGSQGASSCPSSHDQGEKGASRIPMTREPTPVSHPEVPNITSQADSGCSTPNRSPKTSTFNSRFPFFGRRGKTDRAASQAEKKDRPPRKGPAAGTGHEGYGRLGAIRRRSGVSLAANHGHSGPGPSQDSLGGNQPMDAFLLERINPVVISGGEIVDNRNASSSLTRIESNQSSLLSRPSMESRDSEMSTTSSPSRPAATRRPAFQRGLKSAVDQRRPSDSSDSDALVMKSTRTKHAPKKNDPEPVAATVKVVQQKPVSVPFYAMLDGSEQEENETLTVDDVLRDTYALGAPFAVPEPPALDPRRLHTTTSCPPDDSVIRATGKPSRLPQVGRIPKVVNTRTESASSRSFSRPFNRVSEQRPLCLTVADPKSIATGPSPPCPSAPELTQTTSSTAAQGAMLKTREEFLAFSPNHSFDGTSSSSGCSDIPPIANTIVVIPDDMGPLVEDEIWDEYNDLIGDTPLPTALSTASSRGIPFHLESYERTMPKKNTQLLESPTIVQSPAASFRTTQEDEKRNTATESSTFSADMTERIKAAFAPKFEDTPWEPSATSEPALKDKPSEHLDRKPSSPSQSQRRNSQASRVSQKSDSSSCRSSEDDTALAQVNLRVGSMTVSKWLSFGHVLFSPTKDDLGPDVGSLKRQSILVIDGLGNDDWSFYAAETYPAASFFNMSPRAPLSPEHRTSTNFPLSPPNHHQIQYTSHLEKFPFGPESFTSVVYRFPTAAPESHYRNVVTEARRVLRPGGYIELSVLDVDLNNMANRGRRTVRRLKERIHEKSPETALGSASDLILRLLGKKGFTDIKTCRVGVPVASIVPKAQAEGAKPAAGGAEKTKDQRSLADMMNDNSEAADENITKMVAKVGRWWYSRCYESAAGSGTTGNGKKKSIWNDRALLAECEEWGTSLKLTVCHARIPERTRVASI
ncbi:hypothetical protein SODALDRAFT_337508 [Sodiomyces alkalinus F11]|uniref:Methyltransferase type 11 domain-containing protein n=1 Tax=Sodiomyces alkalinus (strain CBS 110278 / VKM F-3762 / F11) TaxID=1314773 RepID=A0A3N2PMB3_SODAK|nr:hypothetical protein SODALDRAFT_337508 [Sodiomyces alkalinus F11]ROT35544.1 hypothetical protein SODALDRAFT_337508 [Sodiomyces alkalinus F11]